MTLSHLLNSRVKVYHLEMMFENGEGTSYYVPVVGMEYVPVRLDLQFLRPGKDAPLPIQAGKAPDRIGVMFAEPNAGFVASQVILAVPNDQGLLPVTGAFEIRTIPDPVQAYSTRHHVEISIIETGQDMLSLDRPWPGQY